MLKGLARAIADLVDVTTIRSVVTILALTLAVLSPLAATGAVEHQAATTSTPPAAPTPIPTAAIASRAAELSSILRSLIPPPSAHLNAIEKQIPEMRQRIEDELSAATRFLAGQPTMDMLQAQQRLWQGRHLQVSQWLQAL